MQLHQRSNMIIIVVLHHMHQIWIHTHIQVLYQEFPSPTSLVWYINWFWSYVHLLIQPNILAINSQYFHFMLHHLNIMLLLSLFYHMWIAVFHLDLQVLWTELFHTTWLDQYIHCDWAQIQLLTKPRILSITTQACHIYFQQWNMTLQTHLWH